MIGKITASMLSMIMFSYFICAGVAFYMYTGANERVNDICYDVAEVVSTKRVLSGETYMHLEESLSKYGDFDICLCLIVYNEEGQKVSYRQKENILDRTLSPGDRIYIAAFGSDVNIFEKLTGAPARPCAYKIAAIV